jgi:hypothetical protein
MNSQNFSKLVSIVKIACLLVLFFAGSLLMIAAFETYSLILWPVLALASLICFAIMALAYASWIHSDNLIRKYHNYIMRYNE